MLLIALWSCYFSLVSSFMVAFSKNIISDSHSSNLPHSTPPFPIRLLADSLTSYFYQKADKPTKRTHLLFHHQIHSLWVCMQWLFLPICLSFSLSLLHHPNNLQTCSGVSIGNHLHTCSITNTFRTKLLQQLSTYAVFPSIFFSSHFPPPTPVCTLPLKLH